MPGEGVSDCQQGNRGKRGGAVCTVVRTAEACTVIYTDTLVNPSATPLTALDIYTALGMLRCRVCAAVEAMASNRFLHHGA